MAKGRDTNIEEREEIVLYCISKGKSYREVAAEYSVSYNQVYIWVKKYEQDGRFGLDDRRGKRKLEEVLTERELANRKIKKFEAHLPRSEMRNDFLKKVKELERRRR